MNATIHAMLPRLYVLLLTSAVQLQARSCLTVCGGFCLQRADLLHYHMHSTTRVTRVREEESIDDIVHGSCRRAALRQLRGSCMQQAALARGRVVALQRDMWRRRSDARPHVHRWRWRGRGRPSHSLPRRSLPRRFCPMQHCTLRWLHLAGSLPCLPHDGVWHLPPIPHFQVP